jgi:hypothetical protein
MSKDIFTVTESEAGKRLDVLIQVHLGCSRGLAAGLVYCTTVNGVFAKRPAQKMRYGDKVIIGIPAQEAEAARLSGSEV